MARQTNLGSTLRRRGHRRGYRAPCQSRPSRPRCLRILTHEVDALFHRPSPALRGEATGRLGATQSLLCDRHLLRGARRKGKSFVVSGGIGLLKQSWLKMYRSLPCPRPNLNPEGVKERQVMGWGRGSGWVAGKSCACCIGFSTWCNKRRRDDSCSLAREGEITCA